jgi:glycosyltransferase involved in cell wall biosynthesis
MPTTPLKILHISHNDSIGGAARLAYALHCGLINNNIDSKMLVVKKLTDDNNAQGATNNLAKAIRIIRPYLFKPLTKKLKKFNKTHYSVNLLPSKILKKINESDADILHLHWIGDETISIKEIAKIKKPIVWTFHDMWPFCSIEHISLYDDKPYITNYDNKSFIEKWTFNRKKKYWINKGMTIAACSNWIKNCTEESLIFKNKQVKLIPNGIDCNTFKPLEKIDARNTLKININKKIILFGAMNSTSDPNKGYQFLKKALIKLNNHTSSKDTEIYVFGDSDAPKKQKANIQIPITYMGKITDNNKLALLYSAADVMVVPSVKETFGLTALESIACGTPVVVFKAETGLVDFILHKENGYQAKAFEADDLAKGITWVLEDKNRWKMLSKNAREIALRFSLEKMVDNYINLYSDIIPKNNASK